MEVDGAGGGGQLVAELGKSIWVVGGWRLSLVRLVERDKATEIQAVCVVAKAKARKGKVFRMRALAVQEGPGGARAGSRGDQEVAGRAGVYGWIGVSLQAGG